ncbi:germination protein YpeB [Paenibacillus thermotolerans]|uniref:germination protein YpeB n=1 Tax=Paenibacillus thermotolerans TaxID=3027807 RepID=UPI002367D2DA|nr:MULTISPECIES: germination protein YpeB [unclassified Paenibacillus]
MYQRLSAILFPVFALLFAGTAMWGYQEHQEKNNILIKAENQYQRAFHDLSYYMDQVHEELGASLAVNSKSKFHQKNFVNLWRLTSQAQSEVNQLPLTLMPFHETEQLLANISKFSYRTAMRNLDEKPLTSEETKLLTALYKHAKEIRTDLRKVQEKVLTKQLRWMDVETALASGNENFDNDIIDGFRLMNDKVAEFGNLNFGPTTSDQNMRLSAKSLSGPDVTAEQVKKKAAEFLRTRDTGRMKVVENGAQTDFPTYSVTLDADGHDSPIQLDYTKKGGKLIYYLTSRSVHGKRLSADQAAMRAQQFLRENGYESMRPISFDEYENVASIAFARVMNDITIYPDKLSVKVALDNGQITGLSAGDMLYHTKERKLAKPTLSKEEAAAMLNPNFKIADQSLALIDNDLDEEVLCYEFRGSINGEQYRIYLNADSGYEEKIERIRGAETDAGTGKQQNK